MSIEVKFWPKTKRLENITVHVTEKLDGTNMGLVVRDDYNGEKELVPFSRNRVIHPMSVTGSKTTDTFEFAQFIADNKDKFLTLPNGIYNGEWCGPGIQKNKYNLSERTWFLFNYNPANLEYTDIIADSVPVKYVPFISVFPLQELESNIDSIGRYCMMSKLEPSVKAEGLILHIPELGTRLKHIYP